MRWSTTCPIDSQHYLEHHLKEPLKRIFEPIMKDAQSLITGASPGKLPAACSMIGFAHACILFSAAQRAVTWVGRRCCHLRSMLRSVKQGAAASRIIVEPTCNLQKVHRLKTGS